MFYDTDQPHQGGPVIEKGKPLTQARGAIILIHGRGATAESILTLADELQKPGMVPVENQKVPAADQAGHTLSDLAWLAPQAYYHTWYPYSFLAPLEQNELGLSSALTVIGELVDKVTEAGIPKEKTVLAGFSQGACLSGEYAAQNPDRYGGVVALSGGVIGPEIQEDRYHGDMQGTPVFLGCSDYDPHIPEERVHESAEIFKRLGAVVTKKIYKGLGHTVNDNELHHFREILAKL